MPAVSASGTRHRRSCGRWERSTCRGAYDENGQGEVLRRADVSEGGREVRAEEEGLGRRDSGGTVNAKTWLSVGSPCGCACGCLVLRRESFNGRPERASWRCELHQPHPHGHSAHHSSLMRQRHAQSPRSYPQHFPRSVRCPSRQPWTRSLRLSVGPAPAKSLFPSRTHLPIPPVPRRLQLSIAQLLSIHTFISTSPY
jgi:hypothetical protein